MHDDACLKCNWLSSDPYMCLSICVCMSTKAGMHMRPRPSTTSKASFCVSHTSPLVAALAHERDTLAILPSATRRSTNSSPSASTLSAPAHGGGHGVSASW